MKLKDGILISRTGDCIRLSARMQPASISEGGKKTGGQPPANIAGSEENNCESKRRHSSSLQEGS